MKQVSIFGFIMLCLIGCGPSQQQLAQLESRVAELESLMKSAQSNATVICQDKASCQKAFALTKIYVQENADMKIQLSDDMMIFTYNPTKVGLVGLRATKVPGIGESSSINLEASCRGMSPEFRQMDFYSRCVRRVTDIYTGFKPYIESKLK